MVRKLLAELREFVAPFHDKNAWSLIAICLGVGFLIDPVMVKTVLVWSLQAFAFIAFAVMASRRVVPQISLTDHVKQARQGNTASGLVVLAVAILVAAFALMFSTFARAETLPPNALTYAPMLAERQAALWADAPAPWTLAGLVEQESCPKCWDPRAELKTPREYGFGLGQITIAYNADGSERFNTFKRLTVTYASLRDWRFADRYDPARQLTAVVEMTHALWRRVPPAADTDAQWAFTLASYNGGLGALLQDRLYCANAVGCDTRRWFGHVETHSLKSKAPRPGYGGRSWYAINRGYVRDVLTVRRAKYRRFWPG